MNHAIQIEEKKVAVQFLVPALKLDDIKKVVEALGGIEDISRKKQGKLTPWRELFGGDPDNHSGRVLRGFRLRDDLSQAELAKKINTKQSHISDMERGTSPVGQSVAKKLAKVFNTDPKVFQ